MVLYHTSATMLLSPGLELGWWVADPDPFIITKVVPSISCNAFWTVNI